MNFSKKLLMVRPASFGSNPETLDSNAFQSEEKEDKGEISKLALMEFDSMIKKIRDNDIDLIVLDEPDKEISTDSVFPNNWFSTNENGNLILYPMFSKARRRERREEFILEIQRIGGYELLLNLTEKEKTNTFLEGTGSIVFDHQSKIGYCCESVRSDKALFADLMKYLNYNGLYFKASDKNGSPIYHTNVIMAIGNKKVILCTDSISDKDRNNVLLSIKNTGKDLIDITLDQMNHFAGNMLFVLNKKRKPFWLMSITAFNSLNSNQIKSLEDDAQIITFSVPTIEKYGGGSVRCMLAELF